MIILGCIFIGSLADGIGLLRWFCEKDQVDLL